MTLIWISLLIASFIGGFFASKFRQRNSLVAELDEFELDDFDMLEYLADPYNAPENPIATIKELDEAYVVIVDHDGNDVALKRFPKGDSPRLAKISAEELADEIMND